MQLMCEIDVKIVPGEAPVIRINGENIADKITVFSLELRPGCSPRVSVDFPVFSGCSHVVFKGVDYGRA